MSTRIALRRNVEPERRLVRTGFISKIWGFLCRPAITFGAVKEETLRGALKYALIGLVVLGALTGIMVTVSLSGADQLSDSEWGRMADWLEFIPITILFSVVGGLLFIFIGGAWTHLWVYLLGGRQGHSYRQTVKALAYGATPVYLVGWVPLAVWLGSDLIGATVLIGALASIWALVVTIIGLRELHGITTGRAVAVSVLGIVIPSFVNLSLAVGVSMIVGVIGIILGMFLSY